MPGNSGKGPTTGNRLEHPREERLSCMDPGLHCSLRQVGPTRHSRLQCFKAGSDGASPHVQPGWDKNNWESQQTGSAQVVMEVAVATVTATVDRNIFSRAVHQL